ncbi:hypothetical protein BKG76_13075 [Mycobacteroides franklinii]|uniref:Uncharacterized protein n=1 Tax=Mycobacteroides franklinii TaxID=948102 RepID=A0A1S1L9B5_9MYCO|nr:isoprenylcysteine carboxylmethyltransferase family protein [Mycobacteroides franklinii]OHU21548.1 hypothetical protein BKG76_13075 [Mycobacteroides franklinii]
MDLITTGQVRDVLSSRARLLPFLFSFAVYGLAGITVPLMLLFFGGWWLPKTVDRSASLSTGSAVIIDVALLTLFGLQHTIMARLSFKAFITRWVPDALERTIYVLMVCLVMWLIFLCWQPVPHHVWSAEGVAGVILDIGFWLGFALVYAATLLLNHFYLLGITQSYRHYVTQVPDITVDQLQTHGIYRLVRHPLMTGLLITFWCTSTMTMGHLLWAFGITVYILLGTFFEERDLVARFGSSYRAYATKVPALIPSPFKLFKRRV